MVTQSLFILLIQNTPDVYKIKSILKSRKPLFIFRNHNKYDCDEYVFLSDKCSWQ